MLSGGFWINKWTVTGTTFWMPTQATVRMLKFLCKEERQTFYFQINYLWKYLCSLKKTLWGGYLSSDFKLNFTWKENTEEGHQVDVSCYFVCVILDRFQCSSIFWYHWCCWASWRRPHSLLYIEDRSSELHQVGSTWGGPWGGSLSIWWWIKELKENWVLESVGAVSPTDSKLDFIPSSTVEEEEGFEGLWG